MWHNELKTLKKHLATVDKEQEATPRTTSNKPKDKDTHVCFADYCNDLNITPIKQDKINVIKRQKNYTPPIQTFSQANINDTFEFFDINDAPKEFFRFGQRLLPKQLRDSKTRINHILDLHNLNRTHAINLIENLINQANAGSIIKIIHGVGNHSEYNQPILLGTIRKYLLNSPRVLAFSYGSIPQGDNGVTIVKLSN